MGTGAPGSQHQHPVRRRGQRELSAPEALQAAVLRHDEHFKDGWRGSHDFRFGYDWKRDRRNLFNDQPFDIFYFDRGTTPAELELYNTPTSPINDVVYHSAWLHDTWKTSDRLTFGLGLRFESYRDGWPEQQFAPNGHPQLAGSGHEISTNVEREILQGLSGRLSYVYKNARNVWGEIDVVRAPLYTVPFSFTDPGPDNLLGTGDEQTFQTFDRPAAAGSDRVYKNPEGNNDDFHTVELAHTRRFSGKWMLLTSFGYTWRHLGAANYRPADRMFLDDNGQEATTLYNYKLIGRYTLPFDIGLSGSLKLQSGALWGRTVSVGFPRDGTRTVRVEPLNANRAPTVTILDFRFDKSFRVRDTRLTAMVDVFNTANYGYRDRVAEHDGQLPGSHWHSRPASGPVRREVQLLVRRRRRSRGRWSFNALQRKPLQAICIISVDAFITVSTAEIGATRSGNSPGRFALSHLKEGSS